MALMLSVTPGPDDILVVRSSLRGGRRCGIATAVGAAAGALVWGTAAATGIAFLVARSAGAFAAMRFGGAGYLLILGALSFSRRSRGTPKHAKRSRFRVDPTLTNRLRMAVTVGFLSDLLNPKIGIFYAAVVPQFIPPGAPVMPYFMLLCAIDVAVALTWLSGLSVTAWTLSRALGSASFNRWSQRCVGVLLIGMGTTVALHI